MQGDWFLIHEKPLRQIPQIKLLRNEAGCQLWIGEEMILFVGNLGQRNETVSCLCFFHSSRDWLKPLNEEPDEMSGAWNGTQIKRCFLVNNYDNQRVDLKMHTWITNIDTSVYLVGVQKQFPNTLISNVPHMHPLDDT